MNIRDEITELKSLDIKNCWKNPGFWGLAAAALAVLWLVGDMLLLGLFEYSTILTFLGAGGFLLALAVPAFYQYRDFKMKLVGWMLCILVFLGAVLGIGPIRMVINTVQTVSDKGAIPLSETISIYSYTQAPLKSEESLNGKPVGILSGKNDAINQFVQEQLAEKNISISTLEYSNLQQMYRALKGQAVRAIVLSPSDLELLSLQPGYENAATTVSELCSFTRTSDVKNTPISVDVSQEPFTILLSAGMDPADASSYRSYATLLLSLDPVNRRMLVTMLPRNLKVPYACAEDLYCVSGSEDKLEYASFYTIDTLKQTVETYLGVSINYTVQVDLDTLMGYADLFGLLQVNNDVEFSAGSYTFSAGQQEFNASKARVYAKVLDDYSDMDSTYEANPFVLLKAFTEQMSLQNVTQVQPLMRLLRQSLQTNLSDREVIALLRMFYREKTPWTYYYIALQGTSGFEYLSQLTNTGYVIYGEEGSRQSVVAAIQSILDQKVPEQASLLKDVQVFHNFALLPQTSQSAEESDSQPEEADSSQEQDAGQDALEDEQQPEAEDSWSEQEQLSEQEPEPAAEQETEETDSEEVQSE